MSKKIFVAAVASVLAVSSMAAVSFATPTIIAERESRASVVLPADQFSRADYDSKSNIYKIKQTAVP